eukprot:tig00020563_g11282.t1
MKKVRFKGPPVPGPEAHPSERREALVLAAAEDDGHDDLSLITPFRSCFLFSPEHRLRVTLARFLHSPLYGFLNLLSVALACAVAATREGRGAWLAVDLAVTIYFTAECLAKIVVLGFVLHPGAYLRSPWLVLELLVTALGWIALLPAVDSFTSLRTIRLLRTLKSVSAIRTGPASHAPRPAPPGPVSPAPRPRPRAPPAPPRPAPPRPPSVPASYSPLQNARRRAPRPVSSSALSSPVSSTPLLTASPPSFAPRPPALPPTPPPRNPPAAVRVFTRAVLAAIPLLLQCAIQLVFFFALFGIIGVSVFAGSLRFHPVDGLTGEPPAGVDPESPEYLCGPNIPPARNPGPGFICVPSTNPTYGYTSFDTAPAAWLVLWQCLTNGWSTFMYWVWDSVGAASVPYFWSVILIGSFLILNLMLAVVNDTYVNLQIAERSRRAGLSDGPAPDTRLEPEARAVKRLRARFLRVPARVFSRLLARAREPAAGLPPRRQRVEDLLVSPAYRYATDAATWGGAVVLSCYHADVGETGLAVLRAPPAPARRP